MFSSGRSSQTILAFPFPKNRGSDSELGARMASVAFTGEGVDEGRGHAFLGESLDPSDKSFGDSLGDSARDLS